MQGLSDAERTGCKNMLSIMSTGDILSLSDTVTNKMIVVDSVTDAVEAILAYTKDAEELLKRKKVHRDIIFKYLAKEGVVMPPNSDKHQLAKRALEFWSNVGVKTEKVSASQSPVSETSVRPAERASLSTEVVGDAGFDSMTLAKDFCLWFYQLLNSQNPSLSQAAQDWGPQHFWENARLRLFTSADGEQMEEFQGAELVSLRLLALARDEKLLLSPNLEPHGLRALSSPHGLVLVAVAGTIHRDGACLGIYEQVFGLVRCPLDDRWKMKFVNLKIRGQDSVRGAEELASPALTCDSSELQLLCR